jgi:ribosome-binding factor A
MAKASGGAGNPRRERVSRLLLDHLADLIRREVKDPRVDAAGLATVNHVELNRDMSIARVYVSFFGAEAGERAIEAAMKGLDKAAGFLRSSLGKRLHMKRLPELRFVHDQGPEMQQRLRELALEESPAGAPGDPDAEGASAGEGAASEGAPAEEDHE